jgi:hypothetical protein
MQQYSDSVSSATLSEPAAQDEAASNKAQSRPPRPTALPVKPENISDELRGRNQWVLWKLDEKKGKIPCNTHRR